jgi:hypothetical protein
MNLEIQTDNIEDQLTRRQKLVRRVGAPLAAIAALGTLHFGTSHEGSPRAESLVVETATATSTASSEFGGSESGYEHGATVSAIENALTEGIPEALDKVGAPGNINVEEIVDETPKFEQANQALEMAKKKIDVIVDEGDVVNVTVKVKADEYSNISYKVTDAEIIDVHNNQG